MYGTSAWNELINDVDGSAALDWIYVPLAGGEVLHWWKACRRSAASVFGDFLQSTHATPPLVCSEKLTTQSITLTYLRDIHVGDLVKWTKSRRSFQAVISF